MCLKFNNFGGDFILEENANKKKLHLNLTYFLALYIVVIFFLKMQKKVLLTVSDLNIGNNKGFLHFMFYIFMYFLFSNTEINYEINR